jgi:hypothetical protein
VSEKTVKDVEESTYGLFSATNPAFSLTDWTLQTIRLDSLPAEYQTQKLLNITYSGNKKKHKVWSFGTLSTT